MTPEMYAEWREEDTHCARCGSRVEFLEPSSLPDCLCPEGPTKVHPSRLLCPYCYYPPFLCRCHRGDQ